MGKAILDDSCEGVSVINEMNVPVLCMGLKDVIVAAAPDGILVTDKEASGRIKPYVDGIEQQIMFAEKSWGRYQVLDVQDASMTLKVTLKAGQSMSYHAHAHRDEVWTVVSGDGEVLVDGMAQAVRPGDVITLVAGCKHRIKARTELTLIEVQLGREITVQDKTKYPEP